MNLRTNFHSEQRRSSPQSSVYNLRLQAFSTFCACCLSKVLASLRSRRLEEVGARKNGRARERHAREFLSPRVSPPRAPVLSCVHYFQEPATQARYSLGTDERASILQEPTPEFGYSDADGVHQDLVVRHSSGHPRSPCQTFCAAVEPR